MPAGWIRKERLRRRSKFNSAGIINKRERRKLGRSTIMNQPLMTMASSFVMPWLISMCFFPRDDSRDLRMKLTARFLLVSFYSRNMEDDCWKYQFGHIRYKYDDYFQFQFNESINWRFSNTIGVIMKINGSKKQKDSTAESYANVNPLRVKIRLIQKWWK